MFDRDVFVLQAGRLGFRGIEQARQPLGDKDLTRGRARPGLTGTALEVVFESSVHGGRIGAGPLEQTRDQPVGPVEQR